MQTYFDIPKNLDSTPKYVALGYFDGVHIGHQKLIKTMVQDAERNNGQSIVVTFESHPKKVLDPNSIPKLLTSLRMKSRLMAELGVDMLVCLPFTKHIASLSPKSFLEQVLVNYLKPTAVYVGFNYRFGSGGVGTAEHLKRYGTQLGFDVMIIPPILLDDKPVSSTYVRFLLMEGKIQEARRYLGYWPTIEGEVTTGDSIARRIGYPTANLSIHKDYLIPKPGVYAGYTILDSKRYSVIANVGYRPTVTDDGRLQVELHILNFEGNLYKKNICFSIRTWVRDETKFNNIDELGKQIQNDIAYVKSLKLPY